MRLTLAELTIAISLISGVALAGDTAFIKTVEIHQELPDFRFEYLEAVPSGTHPDIDATDCPDFTIQKQDQRFELSGAIRKKGWPVIAEVQLAQYKLIAFAGKFKPNTSSTCEISQSNIAVFEDDELLGVIYLGSPEDAWVFVTGQEVTKYKQNLPLHQDAAAWKNVDFGFYLDRLAELPKAQSRTTGYLNRLNKHNKFFNPKTITKV